jgi:hypothetical protein
MANVKMIFDAESAKAVQAFMKIENKSKALEEQNKRLNKNSKAGSMEAIKSIGNMATAFLGVGTAVGIATKAVAEFNAERKRGAESLIEKDKGMGSLAQLAGSAAELKKMVGEANRSRIDEGMTSEEAGRLQFALESSGKGKQRSTYARLYGMADPTEMLEAVNTLQGSMGSKETGNDRQVLDKLFYFSSQTKTNVTDLAAASAAAGKMAKMVGTSDEELYAAIASMARGDASAQVVGTQVEALAAAASQNKKVKTGKGIIDIVKQIDSMRLNEAGLYKLLGRKEAVKAYLSISDNLSDIESMTESGNDVDRAAATGKGDYTGARVQSYRSEFMSQRLARRKKQRRLISEEDANKGELMREALVDDLNVRDREEGRGFIGRAGREVMARALTYFTSDENLMKMHLHSGQVNSNREMIEAPVGSGYEVRPKKDPNRHTQ